MSSPAHSCPASACRCFLCTSPPGAQSRTDVHRSPSLTHTLYRPLIPLPCALVAPPCNPSLRCPHSRTVARPFSPMGTIRATPAPAPVMFPPPSPTRHRAPAVA
ncbi:hypothetical protein EVG20_g10041, partial [Dentipellis fragilis]